MKYIHPRRLFRIFIKFFFTYCWAHFQSSEIDLFIKRMNCISKHSGLKHSIWTSPSGMPRKGHDSTTTARDLVKITVEALNYPILVEMFKKAEYHISGAGFSMTVRSTFLGNRKNIIFAKTGSASSQYNLSAIAELHGEKVVCAVMNVLKKDKLYVIFEELMDIIDNILSGKHFKKNLVNGINVCACLIKESDGKYSISEEIFSNNADEKLLAWSTTKILTLITALRMGINLNRTVTFYPVDEFEMDGAAGTFFKPFQKVKVEDLFYSILLSSSCQSANALARVCSLYRNPSN